MLEQLETMILGGLQSLFDQFGWAGVAGLMAFENATGITPSEVILTFAGWMLIAARDLSPVVILYGGFVAALGSSLGASSAYWAARLGGRPLVDRAARLFRLDPAYLTRVEQQLARRGVWLVLAGRLVPGVRTLISIPAGLARVPFVRFFLATFVGTYLWCSLFLGAGYLLGHEWHLVSGLVKQALPYLLAAGVAGLAVIALWKRQPRIEKIQTEIE